MSITDILGGARSRHEQKRHQQRNASAPQPAATWKPEEVYRRPAQKRKFDDDEKREPKRQRFSHTKLSPVQYLWLATHYQNKNTAKQHQKLQKLISNPMNTKTSFEQIGVCRELCIAVKKMKWDSPTNIQRECIPHVLLGKDIIALAETGSGKTGAFAIPIIQSLLNKPISHHSLVISPTRELALQIQEQFDELGKDIGLQSIAIIGGVDRVRQAIKLQQKQHVMIGTPGRILDHLITCKGMKLYNLRYFVLDEADRILQTEFAECIEQVITIIQKNKHDHQTKLFELAKKDNPQIADEWEPNAHNYQTMLFSATMTSKVVRLEKASLRASETVKVEVNTKYATVSTLTQFYLFVPAKHKIVYMVYMMRSFFNDRSVIIFTNTKRSCHQLSLVMHNLNMQVIPLHGEMNQYERMGAIEKFKEGDKSILVATDVAARGLDIPFVTVIVNYDIPIHSKDYVHRVGRTARAGKKGKALNLVTQYDVEVFQRIEQLIRVKMDKYPGVQTNDAMQLVERVMKADRVAQMQMKDHKEQVRRKIRTLSRLKRGKGDAPRLEERDENEFGDDKNSFAIDDVDYEVEGGGRKLGPVSRSSGYKGEGRGGRRGGGRGRGRGRGRGKGRGGRRGSGRSRAYDRGNRAQSFDSMTNYKKSFNF